MERLCLNDYDNNQHEFRSFDESLLLFHLLFTRYAYVVGLISWVIMFLVDLSLTGIKDFPAERSVIDLLPFFIFFLCLHYLFFRKQVYRIIFYEDSIVLFPMLKKDPLLFPLEELLAIKIGWFLYTYKFSNNRSFGFVDHNINNLQFLEKHGFPLV